MAKKPVKKRKSSNEVVITNPPTKIVKNGRYGDFIALHKRKGKDEYQIECAACQNKRWEAGDKILTELTCDCSVKSITKLDNKELSSMFGEQNSKIMGLLQKGDTEKATVHFQRQMLATLVDMIPIAEAKYRETSHERAAYAMNSLISQCRELISDIEANNSSQQLANTLLIKIIKPFCSNILQNIIDTTHFLKKRVESNIKEGFQQETNTYVDDAVKSIGLYMEQSYNALRVQVKEELEH